MKLQINDAGSWRHISNFDALAEGEVRARSARLAYALNERCRLRIMGDRGEVKAYCKGPHFLWEEKSNS